ncbi:hypothetical protein FA09DRAFT_302646 [Tilletiopsis washingtonensis]|uniref:Uncharacterized protein n=1 Tax=Tilletiopsis washingtonensis TaxID=58919 RepID=A0A316YZ37_9BASI|nr:hypothetical protein FA09DRAFT_302646 [Tilletiopsis washingtonensis]PWN94720.1 hypothetical protein FA09DRAFT_302646 [Tilletiopsis washingtonensis]
MSSSSQNNGYTIKSTGTNSQGNHWCSREFGPSAPSQNNYHYSNKDGSFHYKNPDGSTYHNDGKGNSTYTTPSGYQVHKSDGQQ